MRWILLLGLMLGACSKGAESDLPSIGEARSLGAEWALVNELHAHGHLSAVYTKSMRGRLKEQLQTNLQSLSQPQSNYAAEIRALVNAPDDASPSDLRAHARALKRIEESLESA